jgi:hypothetical protein
VLHIPVFRISFSGRKFAVEFDQNVLEFAVAVHDMFMVAENNDITQLTEVVSGGPLV